MQLILFILAMLMLVTAAAVALYARVCSPEQTARREELKRREERLGKALRDVLENEID